jgi:hypothetical protein
MTTAMNTAKERAKAEHAELREKLAKLESFLESGKAYSTLKRSTVRLLWIQYYAMQTYSNCLATRILEWEVEGSDEEGDS